MKILIEGFKRSRKILQAPAFDEFRGEELEMSANKQSDEEIADYLRDTAQTLYHPVGTCKMGNDDMAVVDN